MAMAYLPTQDWPDATVLHPPPSTWLEMLGGSDAVPYNTSINCVNVPEKN